ncbi:DUF3139 domain-containing protein [Oceanobacillus sp. AG]|uniref:DUF3139 domain-containing protein n=1 Tax=Oceanobacillus sp. AG TaxID=2681969 RepID=UPI0012EB75DF|nr:DUF3139 domain-containing protein [Oceanobacillus sp. AG]
MQKKLIFISLITVVVIIAAIPASFLYVLNNGNPYTKYIANKHVPAYLGEQGYTDGEIADAHYVEPKHLINRDFYHGHYMVVFKDERDITYYYGVTKKGKEVKQFCEKDILLPNGVTDIFEEATKYSEKECHHSLDNR